MGLGKIYTIVNQKGGVGKTTTAINLGSYLGFYGQRVLIVDIDPQANATSCLGIDKNTIQGGTYDVLIGAQPILTQILHNPRFKLSLLPASPALAGAEIELIEMENRGNRLHQVLNPIRNRYDYILVDCPPSLGLLTLNGLVAAQDGLLIPVQCEYLALEGLGQLTQTINRVKSSLFPNLSIRGVILTMYDGRTNLSADVAAEVRGAFDSLVFDTIIPRSIRLAEAPSYGMPISVFEPGSSGARAYRALAKELMTKDNVQVPIIQEAM
ncbi:MAG: Chromosome partitioning protein ParA [Anaerolinea thermophila]|uniref:Chromosome partitioning protein ParA n=1 Tax=Anaerolinea thermophila TaxID=167964 RepID=A0A124FMT1_9CHLR|nr:MAG: Chromosome partitioning protein ParA [Anaerolinea thermophila]